MAKIFMRPIDNLSNDILTSFVILLTGKKINALLKFEFVQD